MADGERYAYMRQSAHYQYPRRTPTMDPTWPGTRLLASEEYIAASRDDYEYGDGRDDLWMSGKD